LAEDFIFGEILGGKKIGASQDGENEGEHKKGFGFHGIEEDTPAGDRELRKMRRLGKPRSASARRLA